MRKFIKGKKAVSHLEIIISFLIFTLFVFFIIYYLNPVRHQNINNVLFSILQDSVKKSTEVNLLETPLILNKEDVSICFIVPSPYISAQYLSVFKENKQQILYNSHGGTANKLAIYGNKNTGKIYYIYYSPDQNLTNLDGTTLVSCNDLTLISILNNYSFSSTRTFKLYSFRKLVDLNKTYYDDYTGLKNELNFPSGNDFNIFIRKTGENFNLISMENKKPEKIEVFAVEVSIQIMENSGNIVSGILNIQVW